MSATAAGAPAAFRFDVYGRRYCHLCDELVAALRALLATSEGIPEFEIRLVDVDADDALEARYGERVPVLVHGDSELCHFRLDVPAVTAYLGQFR
jgi:thioredoxin reductase (NADPH)